MSTVNFDRIVTIPLAVILEHRYKTLNYINLLQISMSSWSLSSQWHFHNDMAMMCLRTIINLVLNWKPSPKMTPTKNILTLQSNKKTVETVLIIYIYIYWTDAGLYCRMDLSLLINCRRNIFSLFHHHINIIHTNDKRFSCDIRTTQMCSHTFPVAWLWNPELCKWHIYIYSLLISALNVTTVLIFLLVATIFINIQHNC